jgi:hypothetical protein
LHRPSDASPRLALLRETIYYRLFIFLLLSEKRSFTEIGFQYDVLINAKVFTEKEWQGQKPSLFYKNVEQDGIEIV